MDNNEDDFTQAAKRLLDRGQQILKQVTDEITVRMESLDLDDLPRKAEEALGRKNEAKRPRPAAAAPEAAPDPAPDPDPAPVEDEPQAPNVTRFRDSVRVDDQEPAASKISRFSNGELVEDDDSATDATPDPMDDPAVRAAQQERLRELHAERQERLDMQAAEAEAAEDFEESQPAEDDDTLSDRAFGLMDDFAARFSIPQDAVDRIKAETERALYAAQVARDEMVLAFETAKDKLDEPTRARMSEVIDKANDLASQTRNHAKAGADAAKDAAAKARKREQARLIKQMEKEVERHKKDAVKAATGMAASAALYALLKLSHKDTGEK